MPGRPTYPQAPRILEMLLAGMTVAEIAAAEALSPVTVRHATDALRRAHDAPTMAVLVARVWTARHAAVARERDRLRAALAAVEERAGERRRKE